MCEPKIERTTHTYQPIRELVDLPEQLITHTQPSPGTKRQPGVQSDIPRAMSVLSSS